MILPPATLGMLGGGQLGRFFVMDCPRNGLPGDRPRPRRPQPAGPHCRPPLGRRLRRSGCAQRTRGKLRAVTTEFENVPAESLAYLAPVRPGQTRRAKRWRSARTAWRKRASSSAAASPCAVCGSAQQRPIWPPPAALLPGILKGGPLQLRRQGQARVASRAEALPPSGISRGEACVLEALLPLDCEVRWFSRAASGEVRYFPVAENSHARGILDISIAPARAGVGIVPQMTKWCAGNCHPRRTENELRRRPRRPFFVSRGRPPRQQMAPRPHNSGHYTIDACATNQFEQQVRALCDLPLGEPRGHSAAAMVNLLGDLWYLDDPHQAKEADWSTLLAVPNLKLHLYGKHHARPGRKMATSR